MFRKFGVLLLTFTSGWCSVIIPEELPSLLSVAYSNIPPIKKGTDSRVGFGFAFGNHADFQVMLELGPQTETKKLAETGFSTNSKRQALYSTTNKVTKNGQKADSGNYLQTWAQQMKQPPKKVHKPLPRPGEVPNLEDSVVELVKNQKGEYEIHQPKPGHISQKVMDDLKRLYGIKKEEAQNLGEQKRTEEEIKKITEDLSNVDLD
ncbi:hypothetical protein ACJJTC_019118 [Scirpophaga incertulas]